MADDFAACVARLQDAAVAAGVTRTVAAAALDPVQSDARVLALAQIQPEFKMPIWDYLGFLVDQQRIDDGRARMQQHEQILRAVEQHCIAQALRLMGWRLRADTVYAVDIRTPRRRF
jgi:membrane-bound lytic murein transglycosylase B